MKRTNHIRGWLVNQERRKRRDRSGTLTDKQVSSLLRKIDSIPKYTKLNKDTNQLIRTRDKALISLAWIFFKRAGENLRLKLADVYYDEHELNVTFHISKKKKGVKLCPVCDEQNGRRAKFCRACGADLEAVPIIEQGQTLVTTKRKILEYPFCKTFVHWIEALKRLKCKPEAWVFAGYNYFVSGFLWYSLKPLSVQRFNQILQKLDRTLTSSHFRYGHTEKLLRLGYSPTDLKEIGDWSSSHMPEIYGRRIGWTPAQAKFAKDTRRV